MEDWDIVKIEKDSLGGPDIAKFADGYRMPLKPRIKLGDLLKEIEDNEGLLGMHEVL